MRRTAKEKYGDCIAEASTALRALRDRPITRGDLADAFAAFEKWKQETATRLSTYAEKDREAFLNLVSIDESASGDELSSAMETYESMLRQVACDLSTINVRGGYDDDIRLPLERIDDLLSHLADLYSRATSGGRMNVQTAAAGLDRWQERAYEALREYVGDDEAAKVFRIHNEYRPIEDQFDTFITHLLDLKEELQKYPESFLRQTLPTARDESARALERNTRVFVVHGHGYLKDAVARVLAALGLDPVILEEKPSAGRTIIEKVEKYSDVGYAVVLLAPDDLGGKRGEELHDRARQNVIFELGYFVGKLGRGSVLYSEGLELPSDLAGVEYLAFDQKGAWKYRLGKELKEAGYEIDLNNL